jgi:hypothetical protein
MSSRLGKEDIAKYRGFRYKWVYFFLPANICFGLGKVREPV